MIWTTPKKISLLILIGLSLAISGFVLFIVFPMIMKSEIKKRLVIEEGSDSFKYWKDVPVPIYLHFYFFNITNIDEIWSLKNKPVLEEIGPYTFREAREKVGIRWNNNGTVTYRQVKKWYFQPDRTNGSLDDIVTTLNVPMVAAAMKGKDYDSEYIYYALEELFIQLRCQWFVKKKVHELLFDGYDDPLMKVAKKFMNLPYDKFGWFYKRNGTDDGIFNAYTGKNDISEVGVANTWNFRTNVTAFQAPCNIVNGSAGDMWPPNEVRGGEVTLFVTDICRSLTFNYLEDVDFGHVRTYRYWANNIQLDNGQLDPDKKCFCHKDKCLPTGAVDVSVCKFDAPAVVSYPHFLYADSDYAQTVIGMRPDPALHRMYLDIVPQMGIPLSVAARMQINILFERIANISQFENITSRIYFPVLWFSETAEAGSDILSQLNLVLHILPVISNVFSSFMVIIGGLLVMSAFVLSILYAKGKLQDKSKNGHEPLIENQSA